MNLFNKREWTDAAKESAFLLVSLWILSMLFGAVSLPIVEIPTIAIGIGTFIGLMIGVWFKGLLRKQFKI